ncbi:nitrite reductase small subunit NirD [Nocardioides bruguierae]|uniref:Nitrite reductase small subunit NirD n=1 Tax=Nocardioides bruguierae TaxID=2945102 RepID=A0A9X2D7B6_9ACTN|nr:nitrite reductase small subunit NirD [Nocardioides bruguierae]MCM0620728.1 nitrite reductase small subunit NirD [Nocardioides bruguierae]
MTATLPDHTTTDEWEPVCRLEQVPAEAGVAALVRGEAVALFRDHRDEVYALSNVCPFARASVLSRGIVGTRSGVPFVASPMKKQPFRLADGVCLDDEAVRVDTWDVKVDGGVVLVGAKRTPA